MSIPSFVWAVGEESSDPIVSSGGSLVRVDELHASEHLARQDADLGDVAALGVSVLRYGMPWRVAEPHPGVFDFSQWDDAIAACARHAITPIVDLCHFGLPDHYSGFADSTWVDGFFRYFDAFCDRFPDLKWFTPVNEPTMTALMSARYGMWNDRLATDHDFARAATNGVRANLYAHHRIVDERNGWTFGAESISIPIGPVNDDAFHYRLMLERACSDLTYGHPLDESVSDVFQSIDDAVLTQINELAITSNHVAGHDFYPISVVDMPNDIPSILDAYETWATAWSSRYDLPFWIAETSNLGLAVERQVDWLNGLSERLLLMRADGLDVRGLCWYSRGDQFDWQTALVEPTGAPTHVGLFTQERNARNVARRFGELAADPRFANGDP